MRTKAQLVTATKWPLLLKLLLSRGGEDNLKAQLGCFPPEEVGLALAVARVVKYRALVHKLHPVAEHSIHESGQFGCHSLNRDRSSEPRPSVAGTRHPGMYRFRARYWLPSSRRWPAGCSSAT